MQADSYPKVYLYRRIVQAKLFLDTHYANHIDLIQVADEAAFSPFHFSRLFKKIYGQTPHQYLTRVRIDNAMQLMRVDQSVSDACFAVGFESLSSFSGLFKRMVGVTPSAYLAQQQGLKIRILQAPLRFVPACFALQHGWKK